MRTGENPSADTGPARRWRSVSTSIIFVQVIAVLVVVAVTGAVTYVEESQRLSAALHTPWRAS